MGKFDIKCKSFYSRPTNFADLINGAVFGGRMVVCAEDLKEAETEVLDKVRGKAYFVDVAKKWIVKDCNLLITAIENQNRIDYGMVIRNMLKEALLYENQVDDIKKFHKEAGDLSQREYISGISESDMLTPVIMVVIYFGDEPWSGPRTLYDMVDVDNELVSFIYNYKLNLIDYHDFEDFEMFHGEVRKVFEALKIKENEEKTKEFISGNPVMYKQTADMLASILNIRLLKKYSTRTEEGDVINMCKAWDDHYESGKKEGITIGERLGEERGEERGEKIGEERGEKIGRQLSILELVKEGYITAGIAASKLQCSEKEIMLLVEGKEN